MHLIILSVVLLPICVSAYPSDYHVVGQGGYKEYMSDWSNDEGAWYTGGRLHPPKCVDIPQNMSLCRDIGYHQMRLPNLLDHDDLREVTSQASSWVPLLGLACHPDTKLFLCSLFSPVCLDRPIWPCRTLCEEVRRGCESKMLKYEYPWPDMLRCDKFPEDNDLCISTQSEGQISDDSVCPACNHPETFEAIVYSFCSSDFAVRIRLKNAVLVGGDMKITTLKKKKKFKDNNLSKKDYRDLEVYIEKASHCDCPGLTNMDKKDLVIVMGSKVNNRLVVNHLVKFDKKNKDIRRALKAMRGKDDICKKGLKAIVETVPPSDAKTDNDEKAKNDKKEKRKKKKNGKKRSKNGKDEEKVQDNNASGKDNNASKKDRQNNRKNNRNNRRNNRRDRENN